MFLGRKSAYDFLVVGLGNPGLQYESTRHNIGFMAADRILTEYGGEFNRRKFDGVFGECKIGGKRGLVLKPQTYMNLSGKSVIAVSGFYKIPHSSIVILFDDVSLELGKIRLRRKGSDGGHNGMKDIIQLFGTDEIMRVKIGVGGKPHPGYDLKDWVLGRFTAEEKEVMDETLLKTAKAVGEITARGIDSAMNRYSS